MSRETTIDQLAEIYRAAFDHICDPKDWKGPIDALVPWDVANVYMQAAEFMTGVKPLCERLFKDNRWVARLTSPGYRQGPCA